MKGRFRPGGRGWRAPVLPQTAAGRAVLPGPERPGPFRGAATGAPEPGRKMP